MSLRKDGGGAVILFKLVGNHGALTPKLISHLYSQYGIHSLPLLFSSGLAPQVAAHGSQMVACKCMEAVEDDLLADGILQVS